MKLYKVPQESYIKLPGGEVLWFERLAGSYSYCKVPTTGEVVHIAAITEVEVVDLEPHDG